MCGNLRTSIILLAVLMLGVPALNAQPSGGELNQDILAKPGSAITFYGHTLGIGSPGQSLPMPMNTQYPWGEADLSQGFVGGGCNYPPVAADSNDGTSCGQSTFWYTTAGFVQIKTANEFAYDKLHNERGQTKDIYFDTARPAISTIFLSADDHPWLVSPFSDLGMAWNWDPGYLPAMVAETWVWHANLGEWSSDPSAKPDLAKIASRDESVTLVAHGKTEPTDLWSLDPTIPSPTCGGTCQTVHPFASELAWDPDFAAAGGVVPYLNDLIVEFQWYEWDETAGERYFVANTWNLNGGEDYPNNIVLPVRNPLDVELVYPRFVHDKLVVLSVLNTPWGSYDVDLESIQVEVRDGNGIEVVPDPDLFQAMISQSVAHSGHYDPINITYIWDYQTQGLKPGDYTLTISADNFQKSYHTETEARFTIAKDGTGTDATAGQSGILTLGGDFEPVDEEPTDDGSGAGTDADDSESKGSPGPALPLLLAALVGSVVLRRRA